MLFSKKNIIPLLIVLSIGVFLSLQAFAENENADDWGSVMKDYNGAGFNRIISDTEYNQAVKTKEYYINKSKEKKKEKKNQEKNGMALDAPPSQGEVLSMPDSPSPLLLLPTDVYYENKIITQGYYLINLKTKGEKYFLTLTQGSLTPIAVIEAKGYIAPGKMILQPKVSVENVDDKMIKINYNGDNLILESTLWKY